MDETRTALTALSFEQIRYHAAKLVLDAFICDQAWRLTQLYD